MPSVCPLSLLANCFYAAIVLSIKTPEQDGKRGAHSIAPRMPDACSAPANVTEMIRAIAPPPLGRNFGAGAAQLIASRCTAHNGTERRLRRSCFDGKGVRYAPSTA